MIPTAVLPLAAADHKKETYGTLGVQGMGLSAHTPRWLLWVVG